MVFKPLQSGIFGNNRGIIEKQKQKGTDDMSTLTWIFIAICLLGWKLRKNSDRQTEALEKIARSRRTFSRPKKIVIRPVKKGGRL